MRLKCTWIFKTLFLLLLKSTAKRVLNYLWYSLQHKKSFENLKIHQCILVFCCINCEFCFLEDVIHIILFCRFFKLKCIKSNVTKYFRPRENIIWFKKDYATKNFLEHYLIPCNYHLFHDNNCLIYLVFHLMFQNNICI